MLEQNSHRTRSGWILRTVLALSLIAAAAGVAIADQPRTAESDPAEAPPSATETAAEAPTATEPTADPVPADPVPPAAALRAYRDPITGEITTLPQPEQIDQLDPAMAKAMSRSTEGLETFELHSGGVGVHLKGRFRSALIVHRHPDGTLSTSCVDHPDHAAEALEADAPTQQPAELEEM